MTVSETSTDASESTTVQGLTYTTVTDPAYENADETVITVTVDFDGIGVVPFSCSSVDPAPHAVKLYAELLAGTYGTIAAYAAPSFTAAELAATARTWRDAQINESQWLVDRHRDQVAEAATTTLTTAQYSALLAYRQNLRDWPAAENFPADDSKPAAPDWLVSAEAAGDTVTSA